MKTLRVPALRALLGLLLCWGGAALPALAQQAFFVSDTEAARFLSQASFGPDAASIAAVQSQGMEGWMQDQLAMPPTLHLEDVLGRFPGGRFPQPSPRR